MKINYLLLLLFSSNFLSENLFCQKSSFSGVIKYKVFAYRCTDDGKSISNKKPAKGYYTLYIDSPKLRAELMLNVLNENDVCIADVSNDSVLTLDKKNKKAIVHGRGYNFEGSWIEMDDDTSILGYKCYKVKLCNTEGEGCYYEWLTNEIQSIKPGEEHQMGWTSYWLKDYITGFPMRIEAVVPGRVKRDKDRSLNTKGIFYQLQCEVVEILTIKPNPSLFLIPSSYQIMY
ncbi:MAG TPA: hypothetical protein VK174_01650 [Chitinophagales bacterium]|nr:hypothetical protein [Chitinophagales bacterium]